MSKDGSNSSLTRNNGDWAHGYGGGGNGNEIRLATQADDVNDGIVNFEALKSSPLVKGLITLWTVIEAILLVVGLMAQGSVLNFFIIYYGKGAVGWFFLLLIDFMVLILFLIAIIFAKKHYSSWRRNQNGDNNGITGGSGGGDVNQIRRFGQAFFNAKFPPTLGVLPLSYISWFIYALVLVVKIFIFFINDIPMKMVSGDDIAPNGPKLFEVSIAATALIFFLWIEAHKNLEDDIHRRWSKALTNELIGHTAFEIFDIIFFLDLITPDLDPVTKSVIHLPHVTPLMKYAIVALGALNVLYPSIGLFKLARLHKHTQQEEALARKHPETHTYGTNILIHFIRLVNVDIPYLLIRIHLAASYDRQLSIFIVKNLLNIIVSLQSLFVECSLWRNHRKTKKITRRRPPQIKILEPSDSVGKPRSGWELSVVPDRKRKSTEKFGEEETPSLIINESGGIMERRNTNQSDQSEDANISMTEIQANHR